MSVPSYGMSRQTLHIDSRSSMKMCQMTSGMEFSRLLHCTVNRHYVSLEKYCWTKSLSESSIDRGSSIDDRKQLEADWPIWDYWATPGTVGEWIGLWVVALAWRGDEPKDVKMWLAWRGGKRIEGLSQDLPGHFPLCTVQRLGAWLVRVGSQGTSSPVTLLIQ